ncbi:MAG: hypothetical protein DCF30_22165 [Hyphomicrobiales bacterium]|nr:MAG: hypothetical protein DCF30_22165 [Hyphomicrobiales bacterium]
MKLKILIDSCVWLDLVKDHRKRPVINALRDFVEDKSIELIMPRVVLDEFARNKERVVKQAEASAKSHCKTVSEAAVRFLGPQEAHTTIRAIHELDQKMTFKGGAASEAVHIIENMLGAAKVVETTDALKLRVFDRALAKRKPFNESKNSTGDAVLIEIYDDAVKRRESGATTVSRLCHLRQPDRHTYLVARKQTFQRSARGQKRRTLVRARCATIGHCLSAGPGWRRCAC